MDTRLQRTVLENFADIVHRSYESRSLKPLLFSPPKEVWQGVRLLSQLPTLHCELDDSEDGRYVRAGIGRKTRVRMAMKLPATYEQFVNGHDRANNLRKSLRRGAKAGLSFSKCDLPAEREEIWLQILSRRGSRKPEDDVATMTDHGSTLVGRDFEDNLLGAAHLVTSASTCVLARLWTVSTDRSKELTTLTRYGLNAFAVRSAIEAGASALLLTGGYLAAPRGLRTYARNSGYSPFRITVSYAQPNRPEM